MKINNRKIITVIDTFILHIIYLHFVSDIEFQIRLIHSVSQKPLIFPSHDLLSQLLSVDALQEKEK